MWCALLPRRFTFNTIIQGLDVESLSQNIYAQFATRAILIMFRTKLLFFVLVGYYCCWWRTVRCATRVPGMRRRSSSPAPDARENAGRVSLSPLSPCVERVDLPQRGDDVQIAPARSASTFILICLEIFMLRLNLITASTSEPFAKS